jgi:hypothetical protein
MSQSQAENGSRVFQQKELHLAIAQRAIHNQPAD